MTGPIQSSVYIKCSNICLCPFSWTYNAWKVSTIWFRSTRRIQLKLLQVGEDAVLIFRGTATLKIRTKKKEVTTKRSVWMSYMLKGKISCWSKASVAKDSILLRGVTKTVWQEVVAKNSSNYELERFCSQLHDIRYRVLFFLWLWWCQYHHWRVWNCGFGETFCTYVVAMSLVWQQSCSETSWSVSSQCFKFSASKLKLAKLSFSMA